LVEWVGLGALCGLQAKALLHSAWRQQQQARQRHVTDLHVCTHTTTQVRPDKPFRLAVGSFKEDTHNQVEIIQRERLTD
jgi:hypothetical protein